MHMQAKLVPSNRWALSRWVGAMDELEMPIKASTREAFLEIESRVDRQAASREYARLVLQDPVLALRLLKEANQCLPKHLRHDITTPLGIILALGVREVGANLEAAQVLDKQGFGYLLCDRQAVMSARVAAAWAELRFDLDPEEVALAVLLANTGELALWVYAPQLAAEVQRLRLEASLGAEEAQQQVLGFRFVDLTLALAEAWSLPELIRELIEGQAHRRAQLARLTLDCVSGYALGLDTPGLTESFQAVAALLDTPVDALVEGFPVEPERREKLLDRLTHSDAGAVSLGPPPGA